MVTGSLKFFCIALFNPFVRISSRIRWRFGRPCRCPFSVFRPFSAVLEPGMVIVTRKEYELTNLFIHGFWTHAGLVVGNGILIEAVGKGIRRTAIEEFFSKVDDFAVYRPGIADREIIRKACDYAEKAVGLNYNYTFRLTNRSFYCSELIYRAFEEGIRHAGETFDYLKAGQLYRDGKMIITPEWLVSTPLQWERVASSRQDMPGLGHTSPENVPLPGRAGKFLHPVPCLFHAPGDHSLCTVC